MKHKVIVAAFLAFGLVFAGGSGAEAAREPAVGKYLDYVHEHRPISERIPAKSLIVLGQQICDALSDTAATERDLLSASPKGAAKKLLRVAIVGATTYLCSDL